MTSKKEFFDEAIELFEDLIDGVNITDHAKDFLQRYYETLKRGNRGGVPRNSYITKQFEIAKKLVAGGALIKDACIQTGLTRDQWNRRTKMEKKDKGIL